jgi:hypothetical protein
MLTRTCAIWACVGESIQGDPVECKPNDRMVQR